MTVVVHPVTSAPRRPPPAARPPASSTPAGASGGDSAGHRARRPGGGQLRLGSLVGVPQIDLDHLRAELHGANGKPRRARQRAVNLEVQFDFWQDAPDQDDVRGRFRAGRPRKFTTTPRPRSIRCQKLTRREIAEGVRLQVYYGQRPATRSQCSEVVRPCPFTTCRYNLYLDVTSEGWLKPNFPHLQPGEMRESCALDVAERGGVELHQLGPLLNLTQAGVAKIVDSGLRKVAAHVAPEALVAMLRKRGK